MTTPIRGPFTVKLAPLPTHDTAAGSLLGRRSLDKQFDGELTGTSVGEMLSAGTAVKGSAGYVAIERVTGTLGGQAGSFVLQHSSTMNRSVPTQSIQVVPDSGTDELTGLSGTMVIEITGGQHFYNFTYELPAT